MKNIKSLAVFSAVNAGNYHLKHNKQLRIPEDLVELIAVMLDEYNSVKDILKQAMEDGQDV